MGGCEVWVVEVWVVVRYKLTTIFTTATKNQIRMNSYNNLFRNIICHKENHKYLLEYIHAISDNCFRLHFVSHFVSGYNTPQRGPMLG